MHAQRAIQLQCDSPSCRRRLNLKPTDLYHVTVPGRHGGSHKEAGFDCPQCGKENVVPLTRLPKGILGQLPSRERWHERRAKHPPIPAWSLGQQAQEVLRKALADAYAAYDAPIPPRGANAIDSAILFRDTDGTLQRASGIDLLGRPFDEVLARLDGMNAEMLVLGGPSADGGRWRVVLEHRAGAASFLSPGA